MVNSCLIGVAPGKEEEIGNIENSKWQGDKSQRLHSDKVREFEHSELREAENKSHDGDSIWFEVEH